MGGRLTAQKGIVQPTEKSEVLAAWANVLDTGIYVNGPYLAAFEREFASYIGVDHAIGVSSGTDALILALAALGVGPGDEVIVPALTFIATAEAVAHVGAIPVFADVDADTWCITPETVAPWITDRTAALLPVHLFGNPAPIDDLRDAFALPILEDACQAVGSTYNGKRCGALGVAAAVSFYPSKTLAGFGDGGAVLTDDPDTAQAVRSLRSHGSEDNRTHYRIGRTARLDELQAAGLRVAMRHLPRRIAAQRRRGMGDQKATLGGVSACHQTVWLGEGPGRKFYDPPCHLQPSMRRYFRRSLPNAETFARANYAEPPIQATPGTSPAEGSRAASRPHARAA